jgi:hypothetical protein
MTRVRWVVRDAYGLAFWWGDAESKGDALRQARGVVDTARANDNDEGGTLAPGPWSARVAS